MLTSQEVCSSLSLYPIAETATDYTVTLAGDFITPEREHEVRVRGLAVIEAARAADKLVIIAEIHVPQERPSGTGVDYTPATTVQLAHAASGEWTGFEELTDALNAIL